MNLFLWSLLAEKGSISIIYIIVKMFERILPQRLTVIPKAKRVHYSVCMSK